LAKVTDPSKEASTNESFQKQGTYRCQVKLFGSWKSFTSDPLLVTFRGVLNGIVTIQTKNAVDIISEMNKVVNIITDVSKFLKTT
jgi:hypothetical protein